jgi:hypothetical protein
MSSSKAWWRCKIRVTGAGKKNIHAVASAPDMTRGMVWRSRRRCGASARATASESREVAFDICHSFVGLTSFILKPLDGDKTDARRGSHHLRSFTVSLSCSTCDVVDGLADIGEMIVSCFHVG